MSAFRFELVARSGAARAGILHTPHGAVATPLFMTVGTQGTVKGLLPSTLTQLGTPMLLANAYHLALRPGAEIVRTLGGVHGLMNWPGPILTDSGGFQMFSLAEQCRVDDDGVTFRSHIDGAALRMTPESTTALQQALGADVIMCFDQCLRNPAPRDAAARAVERTLAWAERCRAAHDDGRQVLFGIVQGATDIELRTACARRLQEIGFFGYAVGGLSVGEARAETQAILAATTALLPPAAPRYLMGVGAPEDLLAAIARGVDLFDCVLPTRNGRAAQALTADGPLNLRNACYTADTRPLDESCPLADLRGASRAAIRHYFKANEMLGPILVSMHNLWFIQQLMSAARAAILADEYAAFSERFLVRYRGAQERDTASCNTTDNPLRG
jgi:queuine tRNA-ribosyltransferase